MKPTNLIFLSLLSAITCTGCIWFVSPPSTGEREVKGNCGSLDCEELLSQVRSNWQSQMINYEHDCQGRVLGVNTYESEGIEKVSFVCWEEPAADGTIQGEWLGTLPFPGSEDTFASKWSCDETLEDCETTLMQLREMNSEVMAKYEVKCAIKDGNLRLLAESTQKSAQVQCSFFAPSIQIDDNGDGISDGEMSKPTGVDIILGKLKLPEASES